MLRITKFLNRSTTEIQLAFNLELDPDIGVGNITVASNTPNISSLDVKYTRIKGRVLSIGIAPQSPKVLYYVELKSTDLQPFQSIDGSVLQEDKKVNRFYFVGLEGTNDIRDTIIDDAPLTYDMDNNTTVRKYFSSLADSLLKARTEIRETGNANYLSVEINDEIKQRGFGPTDRLLNEGAYEVLRVGKLPEGAAAYRVISFNSNLASSILGSDVSKANTQTLAFPSDPVSLREVTVTEAVSNAETLSNSFDGLLISLSKQNVIRLNALILTSDGVETVYDIPTYGYSIKSNRYDTVHGRPYVTLESNQIRLSEGAVIDGAFSEPAGSDQLTVSYTYVDNGRNVDENDENSPLEVYKINQQVREGIGPYLTIFSLNHWPIVNAIGRSIDSGGVVFADPSGAIPFVSTHPAFTREIVYSASKLPSRPGEYAVNYNTGQVFVYGAVDADGTGGTPPVATYYYKHTFAEDIDYSLDVDADEVVAIAGRDLIGEEANISFVYEDVLAPFVDYIPEVHIESAEEYVENRFTSSRSFATLNRPITNVFSVINESTGETYNIDRFNDNEVYISGTQLPREETEAFEPASFARSSREEIYVTDVVSDLGAEEIVSIALAHGNILAEKGSKVAFNANSSLQLSDSTHFIREFFYDSVLQDLATNLLKLSAVGDYMVNYEAGVIYVRVPADNGYDYGEASYNYGDVLPSRPNVTSVNEIAYYTTVKAESPIESLDYTEINSSSIELDSLPVAAERFLAKNTNKPILLGAISYGVLGYYTSGSTTFISADASFTDDHADGYHILRLDGDADRLITAVNSSTSVEVDLPFTSDRSYVDWCLVDFNLGYPAGDGYKTIATNNIKSVLGIYSITDLQTVDKDSLTNYFNPEVDTISGNTIVLNNASASTLAPGTALAIDYSYGELYLEYNYMLDNVRVTYEWGDNSLNFSISDALDPQEEYYASYRYGALRNGLINNFAALTQLGELISIPSDFDRELYRDILIGTLQGFVKGPTKEAISTLVEQVTKIPPTIRELTFNEWTLGRDNLYPTEASFSGTEEYDTGKYGNGIVVEDSTTISFPAESYLSHREGTYMAWVKPYWSGLENDASLTFTISQDGYEVTDGAGLEDGYRISLSDIYIGPSGYNPVSTPFTINKEDSVPYDVVGRPVNYGQNKGLYIWFDDDANNWKVIGVEDYNSGITIDGRVTSTGEFYNVVVDGYTEASDKLRSTSSYVEFSFTYDGYEVADGYDGYVSFTPPDGYLHHDGIKFQANDLHYLWDAGPAEYNNRMSIYKDGSGYLNFRVYDDSDKRKPGLAKYYNLSSNIQDWSENELHFISASWRLNSAEGVDQMHLFIDGQEVSNVFKYGGKPGSTTSDVYRTVTEEELESSATKNTFSGNDGYSSATAVFTSASAQFLTNGVAPGDTLDILDATADGAGSPYTVLSVDSESQITLTTSLLLTLSNIKFSVNKASYAMSTNGDVEDIAVFVVDGYGTRAELHGVEASDPDYAISRTNGETSIDIYDGVSIGDSILVTSLGLTQGRCRDVVYKYDTSNTLETRLAPPTSFSNFDLYKVFIPRTSIEQQGAPRFPLGVFDGYFTVSGSQADGYFTDVCSPSNATNGKSIAVTLGGLSNIDFGGTNTVTIWGNTFDGYTSETLSFSDYGTLTTNNYFTSLAAFDMTFTAIDPSISFGSIKVSEAVSITRSENSGDYAQLVGYDNGRFSFIIYGGGGLVFDLEPCYYQLDFPLSLNIPMSEKGDMYIGSDIKGENQWDGVIDHQIILNEMLDDVRAGEDKSAQRTITSYYNSPLPTLSTPQTLMKLDFDNGYEVDPRYYKTFDERFLTTSRSVNANFGDAAVFLDDSYVIDNGSIVFDKNEGTIEFWVAPLVDTLFDESKTRFFVDVTSIKVEEIVSSTANTLTLPARAKRVNSVRLLSDSGNGTNYYDGGKLFIDGKTVFLGIPLPSGNTRVQVEYIPIDFNGDRVSIYKDGYGYLNFSILANDEFFNIAYQISWRRDTWHRVMATWKTNTDNNQDRMRLFIDGIESGTITYGTPGLLYGSGVIYGSAAVGSLDADFMTANIDINDTFGQVHIGNSFDGNNPCKSKIDNLRFSDVARSPSIVSGVAVDLNYNANLDAVFPVVEDGFTTGIYDFNRDVVETEFLANVLSKYDPLFRLEIIIDDSFGRIGDNQLARDILESVIQRMKPAHSNIFIKFLQE